MIDINDLRRMAQAATPGPWIGCGPSFGESLPKYLNEVAVDREGDEDDGYSICNAPIGLEEQCSDDMAFIGAANPAAVIELLDRLEAAESALSNLGVTPKEAREGLARHKATLTRLEAAEKERDNAIAAAIGVALQADALQAEIDNIKEVQFDLKVSAVAEGWRGKCERLEKERDAAELMSLALRAKVAEMEKQEPAGTVQWIQGRPVVNTYEGVILEPNKPLYALPGAKEKEPTRDWWDCLIADISAIDCMYRGSPTYAHDAYWMREHVVWMLKKRRDALPGAQPAPSVPGGWKLVPTEPTKEMRAAWDSSPICEDDDAEFRRAYSEMLAAAPEAKP